MTNQFFPVAFFFLLLGTLGAQERTIEVTAMSQIKVVPDEVFLDFRIETRKQELMDAKKANDELASKVFRIAKDHGILSTDVSVFDMDLTPVFKRNDDGDADGIKTPIAFRYLRSMQVRMTEFKTIEPFLDECYKVGVQDLSGVSFRLSNQREHQFRARELAVTYCREKATHLTELTGMKLGAPMSIKEDVEESWDTGGFGGGVFGGSASIDKPAVPRALGKSNDRAGTFFVSINNLAELQELDLVAPGQIDINARVSIVYEMTKGE
ncbi:MAG: SIMPL domain-containing protein [Mariniblastus sp.]|nr:SIMPL domain-containing protein [Mariniblastus sp.]